MSNYNREDIAIRLDRMAATAKILANQIRIGCYHSNASDSVKILSEDVEYVKKHISNDRGWSAGDR
jgi:hypothetical protein